MYIKEINKVRQFSCLSLFSISMEYPTNNQIFENYQQEDENPDTPEGSYDIYLERNCFDLLQDNVERDHEIENDNDLEHAEGPSKKRRKICRTTQPTNKSSEISYNTVHP